MLVFWWCVSTSAFGQFSPEEGVPLLNAYDLVEVGPHGQAWQVEQLPNGVLAFANHTGVLFFDGERFTAAPVLGTTYSFGLAPDGRILVGTGRTLGYLEADAAGEWRHHAFELPANSAEYGEIGRAVWAFGRAFYLSRRTLFSHHPDEGWRTYRTHTGYSELRWRDPILMLFEIGKGWQQFDPASDSFVPHPVPFPAQRVLATSNAIGEPWYASDEKSLYRLSEGRWSVFNVSNQRELYTDRVETIERLRSGDLVVGTRFGGLYQYRPDGQLTRRIAPELLPGTRITSFAVDAEGALWMTQDGGVARVEPDNRLTRFGRAQGARQIERIKRIDGQLYAATRQGLKRLQASSEPGTPATFVDHRIARRSTWSLLSTEHGMLVGVGDGLALLPNAPLTEPVQVFAGAYTPGLTTADGWIYAASGNELLRLRWDGSAFRVDPERVALAPVFDLTWQKESLWLSINGGGVYRIDQLSDWPEPRLLRIGPEQGLSNGWTTFSEGQSEFLTFAEGNPLIWDGQRFIPSRKFSQGYSLDRWVEISPELAWASNAPGRLDLLGKDKSGVYRTIQQPLARYQHPTRHMHRDSDGTLWLADETGVLRMSEPPQAEPMRAAPLIRSVESNAGQMLRAGAGTERTLTSLVVTADQRALSLRTALPSFNQERAASWRFSKDQSNWREFDPSSLRLELAAGVNQFWIQAFDGMGRPSPMTQLQVQVAPYWHETLLARVAAVSFALSTLWFTAGWSARRRTRRLELERIRLEQLIVERTSDVRRQAAEIHALSEARTRFFGNVSHEFRTPLTLVLSPLSDALDNRFGTLGDALRNALSTAQASARRLLGLIGELLDLNRLSIGSFALHVAEHDLTEQLRGELQTFKSLAASRQIDLAGEGLGDPLLLWYDADQLERMLSNLLGNALKFTPRGGRVRLRLVSGADEVGIQVEDNGPGIEVAEQAKIFDRYFQGQHASPPDAPGAGVGLALVSELIALHSGRVEVLSDPGAGSCFVLWLRRGHAHFKPEAFSKPELPKIIVNTSAAAPLTEVQAMPSSATGDGRPTLLVVDDHIELRRYLANRLGDAFQIITADDGDQALAKISERQPDVVVSDVMMAGMDGLSLARALRRNPDTAGVPLLLLSARAQKRDIVSGLEAGADDYLTKPFDTSELIARIEAQLHLRRRLRTQLAAERSDTGATLNSAEAFPAAPAAAKDSEQNGPRLHERFANRLHATLDAHVSDPAFGVSELAAAMHMDRATLFRRIRSAFKTTPSDVLRDHRLRRAEILLRDKRGNVSEVAYAVGYENLSHFSQAFRRRYGVAPSSLLG